MTRFAPRCRAGSCLLAACLSGASLSAQGATLPLPLELRVPKPPTVARAEGGSFLVYELHLTNLGADTLVLKRVEVVTPDTAKGAALSLADSALARSLARPGPAIPPPARGRIAGGTRAVVYLWVPLDPGVPPRSVRHRVTVERPGSGSDSTSTQELLGPAVPVAADALVIGPPLRGGTWLAGNGPSNESGHRRALVTTGGTPAIAQRFAIDWVKMADDGTRSKGDPLRNESYYAWGSEALAVADAIVVATKDGIPENVPGARSRAVPITLETVGGNHVILDLGNGRYAFYAHLQPGSLRVRLGDRVKRGQVLGLVGNSGNSTEPHLHFHVSDANSPLGSEGLPYGYDGFELLGRCTGFLGPCDRPAPAVRHGEIPLQNTLVRFPP